MERTEGSKYQATKDIYGSELVTMIKKDIREQLPKTYKVLARKELYAGGWSIHFTIKNTGINKYYIPKSKYGEPEPEQMSPEYKKLYEQVRRIVEAYNYDSSDMMSDYFSVKFYSHIKVEK